MEKIKEIRDRLFAGGKPSPADKTYIKKLATEHEVDYPKPTCANCWADVAALVYNNLVKYTEGEEPVPDSVQVKHLLREPFRSNGVMWNKRLIRQDIMTDSLYNQLVEAGLGDLFVK